MHDGAAIYTQQCRQRDSVIDRSFKNTEGTERGRKKKFLNLKIENQIKKFKNVFKDFLSSSPQCPLSCR
jgi:hypothetical protein